MTFVYFVHLHLILLVNKDNMPPSALAHLSRTSVDQRAMRIQKSQKVFPLVQERKCDVSAAEGDEKGKQKHEEVRHAEKSFDSLNSAEATVA